MKTLQPIDIDGTVVYPGDLNQCAVNRSQREKSRLVQVCESIVHRLNTACADLSRWDRRRNGVGQQAGQVGGERAGGGVVEGQGCRQGEAGVLVEGVAQFQGGQ